MAIKSPPRCKCKSPKPLWTWSDLNWCYLHPFERPKSCRSKCITSHSNRDHKSRVNSLTFIGGPLGFCADGGLSLLLFPLPSLILGGDVADGYSYINRLPPIQRAAPPPAAVAQPETFFCRLGWSSGGTAFSTSTSSSAEARSRWSTASSATFCKHPSETTFLSPMGRGGASQAVS